MGRLKEILGQALMGVSPLACTGSFYCPDADISAKKAIADITGLTLEQVEENSHLVRGHSAMMSGGGLAHEGYRKLYSDGAVIFEGKHVKANPAVKSTDAKAGPVKA